MTSAAELERNKKIVRSFKECQGTADEVALMREILAPDYKRLRGGMANLAANAQGQPYAETLHGLRGAFPDRVDVIEDIIAEGDRVAVEDHAPDANDGTGRVLTRRVLLGTHVPITLTITRLRRCPSNSA